MRALDLLGFWSSVLSSLFLSLSQLGHTVHVRVRRHQGQFRGNEGETGVECLIASLDLWDDLFNSEERPLHCMCTTMSSFT